MERYTNLQAIKSIVFVFFVVCPLGLFAKGNLKSDNFDTENESKLDATKQHLSKPFLSLPVQKKSLMLELHPIQPDTNQDIALDGEVNKSPHQSIVQLKFPELQKSTKDLPKYTKYPGYDVQLYANTVEYFCEILLGTPGQPFTVQVDTGSSLTAIPASSCSSCGHFNPLYDPSKSSTSKPLMCNSPECSKSACFDKSTGFCSFNISYGDSSNIQGGLVRDKLAFSKTSQNFKSQLVGGLMEMNEEEKRGEGREGVFEGTEIVFGTILKERPEQGFQSRQVDGIFGMAYGVNKMACLPNCVTPIMEELVQKFGIEDIFAMSLEPVEHGVSEGGVLTFGGIAERHHNDTIFYTPILEETYYVVGMHDIEIGGKSIRTKASHYGLTVVDSGTTFTIIPHSVYDNMRTELQTHYCHLPHMCGPNNLFDYGKCLNTSHISEEVLDRYPNITIVMEGVKVTLPPRYYFEKIKNWNGEFYCFGIVDGGESTLTILGDTFMRAFYVIFDRRNKRIGFIGAEGLLEAIPPTEPSSSLFLIVLAGTVVGLTILVIIVTLSIWFKYRRGQHEYYTLLANNDDDDIDYDES